MAENVKREKREIGRARLKETERERERKRETEKNRSPEKNKKGENQFSAFSICLQIGELSFQYNTYVFLLFFIT